MEVKLHGGLNCSQIFLFCYGSLIQQKHCDCRVKMVYLENSSCLYLMTMWIFRKTKNFRMFKKATEILQNSSGKLKREECFVSDNNDETHQGATDQHQALSILSCEQQSPHCLKKMCSSSIV